MLRRLFSFSLAAITGTRICLPALAFVFLAVAFLNTPSLAQQGPDIHVTLNNVHDAVPDSFVSINLEITWPDRPDTLSVDSFSFAIAYDTLAIQLYNVLNNGLADSCGWFFGFTMAPINGSQSPNKVLWLVGDNISQTGCFVSYRRTITLQFRTKDDHSLYGTSTNLDFYWRGCHDNIFWISDPDTAVLALQVLDADGIDITDDAYPLPSFVGPPSSCLDPSVHGGAATTRSVRFQSGKIAFRSPTDAIETPAEGNLPSIATLKQNYPNPFNPSTMIEFFLPQRTSWRVEIVNLQGQVVTRFSGVGGPGSVALQWDGRDGRGCLVSSGVYFYRLVTGEHRLSRKMLLLK